MAQSGSVLWLSGWSVDSSVWEGVVEMAPHLIHEHVDFLGCGSAQAVLERAEEKFVALPSPIRMVGWSLGAILALQLAQRYSECIQQLFLIGSTGRFVRQNDSHGWDSRVLRRMERRIEKDVEGTLRDFDTRLFSEREKARGEGERWQTHRQTMPTDREMRGGLQMLATFDWYQENVSLGVEAYLLSGQEDHICPPEGASRLYSSLSNATLEVWEGAGHLPFWTEEQRFHKWLVERMEA
ncbi:alpha/beta fold hydrolase [Marininema halotolerans]|uniref:Pimeloyl-ACP methyl ester carboxylesterase n=1 Tax=Marininema halotolerans TaxID=1155944 RepID=A0A1I6NT16_9BACL|nr:alpha/beta hydrolase [Marininema halotolerans]SFS31034.1 Pimeloyl-ACP methyl ester carboxylesterase [Marininema halotolerans]